MTRIPNQCRQSWSNKQSKNQTHIVVLVCGYCNNPKYVHKD